MNVLLDLDGTLTAIGVLWGYGSRQELIDAGANALCEQPAVLDAALVKSCFGQPSKASVGGT